MILHDTSFLHTKRGRASCYIDTVPFLKATDGLGAEAKKGEAFYIRLSTGRTESFVWTMLTKTRIVS